MPRKAKLKIGWNWKRIERLEDYNAELRWIEISAFQDGSIQGEEVAEAEETTSVLGDYGFDLSIEKMIRSCLMGRVPKMLSLLSSTF